MALSSSIFASIFSLLVASSFLGLLVRGGNFNDDVEIQWGDGHGKIEDNGELLSLSMDKYSGSGFQSKNWFHYGRLDVEMKLVPGNSAGTVTTFYLSSQGPDKEPNHDEIDFEFLGNVSGSPYTLHTNVFVHGIGNKEMQYHLWFDPTHDFHKYSILWNPHHVIFFVDDVPIRDFKNNEALGAPFPTNKHMRLYSSLWDGEAWATQGGKVKTDWSQAPFVAYYRNFSANACVSDSASGASNCPSTNSLWYNLELDNQSYMKMKSIQSVFRIYNYCSDEKRFARGIPPECALRVPEEGEDRSGEEVEGMPFIEAESENTHFTQQGGGQRGTLATKWVIHLVCGGWYFVILLLPLLM